MTPAVPLRGITSASGDLMPLSYVANALAGNPDISIHRGERGDFIPANQALKIMGLRPLEFGPKEVLGLVNGIPSCGLASLVLCEANQLLLLFQVLIAMGTEALSGSAGNYHPFIASTRPHKGQIEAATDIFDFLRDSQFVGPAGPGTGQRLQDRYALRTSTQWLGPQIETMALVSNKSRRN